MAAIVGPDGREGGREGGLGTVAHCTPPLPRVVGFIQIVVMILK